MKITFLITILVFLNSSIFCFYVGGFPVEEESNSISMLSLINKASEDPCGSFRDIGSKDLLRMYELLNNELDMLLKLKVNLDVQNDNGDTLLHMLSRCIDPKFDKREKWEVDFLTIKIIEKLLAHNANPNIQNNLGQTPLHLACSRMAMDAIELLLAKHASTTIEDKNGLQPIFYARFCFKAYTVPDRWFLSQPSLIEKITKLFLRTKEFSVNAQDNKGDTLLHYASSCFGHCKASHNNDMLSFQRFLLENKANPNIQNNLGETPLHASCDSLILDDRAFNLLIHGADPLLRDDKGNTSLHEAALRRTPENFERMWRYKSDGSSNIKNFEGVTPWHLVDWDHYWEPKNTSSWADLMIKLDGDASLINNKGKAPVHAILKSWSKKNNPWIINNFHRMIQLISKASNPVLFIGAVAEKYPEIIKELIQKIDINYQDPEGSTLLHFAAINNYKELMTMFLAQGADPNIQDNNGFTPLHLAVKKGDYDSANILIDKGADASIVSKLEDDFTGIWHWIKQDHVSLPLEKKLRTFAVLLPFFSNVQIKDKDTGETPLMWAVERQKTDPRTEDLVYILLNSGKLNREYINEKDNQGRTALSFVYDIECDVRDALLLNGAATPAY